jgi:hypothetical protein
MTTDPGEWGIWHRGYDDPKSPLSVRLREVQRQIDAALDRASQRAVRLLSLCAGDGRDVLPRLVAHPAGDRVAGTLVELDPGLAAAARAGAPAGVEVVTADAGDATLLADRVPVDLLLLCGIFGNVAEDDLERLIGAVPALLAPGGTVVWTRHTGAPDRTPAIRTGLAAVGVAETSFIRGRPPMRWSVGAGVLRPGVPVPPLPLRLFAFSTRPDQPQLG